MGSRRAQLHSLAKRDPRFSRIAPSFRPSCLNRPENGMLTRSMAEQGYGSPLSHGNETGVTLLDIRRDSTTRSAGGGVADTGAPGGSRQKHGNLRGGGGGAGDGDTVSGRPS